MNLFLIADLLQEQVNQRVARRAEGENQNLEAIHKLSEAQRLVEEAYAIFSKGEGAIPLDWDHFLKTGENIPK